MTDEMNVEVFFNPACSKCRTVRGILEGRDLQADYVRYLENTPTRERLEDVLRLLGTDDPRAILRSGEPLYRELELDSDDRDEILDALVQHPILIERPIVIAGGRATIGRPPERVIELLDRSAKEEGD